MVLTLCWLWQCMYVSGTGGPPPQPGRQFGVCFSPFLDWSAAGVRMSSVCREVGCLLAEFSSAAESPPCELGVSLGFPATHRGGTQTAYSIKTNTCCHYDIHNSSHTKTGTVGQQLPAAKTVNNHELDVVSKQTTGTSHAFHSTNTATTGVTQTTSF